MTVVIAFVIATIWTLVFIAIAAAMNYQTAVICVLFWFGFVFSCVIFTFGLCNAAGKQCDDSP